MSQSSKGSSEQNLARWSEPKLLTALKELANIRGEDGASRFLQRFPDFVVIKDTGWLARLIEQAGKNPSPQSVEFIETLRKVEHRLLPGLESHIKFLNMIVQEIWRGTAEGMKLLSIFFFVDDVSEAIKIAVALHERVVGNVIFEMLSSVPMGLVAERLQPDWTRRGRFQYEPRTPLQKALYLLWEKSSLAKVCKNPDCPAPFFIAGRVLTQTCGDDCARPFRLEAKMKYWNKTGKKRREAKKGKR